MPGDDEVWPDDRSSRDWGVAVTIGVAILICLAVFVWIFVLLDPLMTDFIGGDDGSFATPAVTASPAP